MLSLLTLAAIVTGVLLLQAVGGTSGRDIGAQATSPRLARAMPLLVVAEVLKLATAVCQYIVVSVASRGQMTRQALAMIMGRAGAMLMGSSGLTGLYAVIAGRPEIGPIASAFAFAAVGITGVWALTFVWTTALPLPRWLSRVGFSFCLLALASIIAAPLALPVGLLSIAWWFGLGRAFKTLG